MTQRKYLFFLIFALLFGCVSRPAGVENEVVPSTEKELSTIDQSEPLGIEQHSTTVLTEFFELLSKGDYDQAAALYGGSYDVLQGYNPDIDSSNHSGLLQAACQFNGFMCLPVRSAELIQMKDQQEFVYDVSFNNPDGTLFELGPCCGASEEIMPTTSIFTVHVICKTQDTCKVMDLPPYVP